MLIAKQLKQIKFYRDFPLNFIMLGIFTICESICLGSVRNILTSLDFNYVKPFLDLVQL